LEVGREEEIEVVVAEVSEVLGGLFVFVFWQRSTGVLSLVLLDFLEF